MKPLRLKRRLRRYVFESAQRFGWNVLPNHFYSETPDMGQLRRESHWRSPLSMTGVNGTDIESQLEFVRRCCSEPRLQERMRRGDIHERAMRRNEYGYGPIEADFLHCFIDRIRPRKVVQVGAGVSTSVVLQAAEEAGYRPEVVCVDPYPTEYLKERSRAGALTLVQEQAQKVSLDTLTDLREGDLLFVDSTHTVKTGSEVNRIVMEALPRLAEGVYVHFHDIYFPYAYQRDLLSLSVHFWNETALLYAFLIGNPRMTIRVSQSMLHYAAPDALRELLPNYVPQQNEDGLRAGDTTGKHFPSSTYLQVV